MTRITEHQIVNTVDKIAKDAMNGLSALNLTLHNRGYHQYSAMVSNMRGKIEQALIDLVEEIER